LEQRERGFGQVPFVGDLPFVVGFDEHRARQAQQRSGVGKTPTTSVQRLTSLFNRSSGLVDQIFFQCGTGKSAKAVMSSEASRAARGRRDGRFGSVRAATL
jgi:hypothetical protein